MITYSNYASSTTIGTNETLWGWTVTFSELNTNLATTFGQLRESFSRAMEPLAREIEKFKKICAHQLELMVARQALWKRSCRALFVPLLSGMTEPVQRDSGGTFRRRVCALSSSYRVRFP